MNVHEGDLKDEIMDENPLKSPNTTPILPPEVASILVRKVDSKTILACRLVNKATKTAVDATLKDEFTSPDKTYRKSNPHRRDKDDYYDRLKKFEVAYTFWEMGEVETFLNKFGDRNEDNNPIITGKLTLGVKANLLITNDRTFTCLKRLLTKFGHLVEHIHIVVGNLGSVDNLVETTAQNKLRAVLRLVRNLKVLSLSSALGVFTDKYIGFMLPKLNKLEYIEFCSEFPRNFVLSFLGCYGEQLTILNCEGKLLNLREHTSCYLKKLLPNVQKVCVNEISVDGLQKLVDVRWPLKHLRIRSFHTSERPTWEDFTYFISPFSKFLVELDILDFTFHKFSEKRSKTVLPEFKKLSFVCTRMEYLYSLEFQNFLSRCPALYGLKVEQPEWTNDNCAFLLSSSVSMNVSEGALKDENPSPVNSLESPNTTPILPPEIWVKLFEYLSPEDCFHVINTCPEFNKMLAVEKTQFLFPQVASILMRKVDSKTILACRLLNKTTKTAVDATLKDEFTSPDKTYRKSHLHRRDKDDYYDRLGKFDHVYAFWERRQVENFMNKFGDRNEDNNPIITGKLTLCVKAKLVVRNDRNFPCLKRLLTKFGHHVKHIHIIGGHVDEYVQLTAQNQLVAVLGLVPNLKVLSLSWGLGVILNENIGHLLPDLNNLEYIEFRSKFRPKFVLSFLDRYGVQLTILNCEGEFLNSREHTGCYLKRLLPNVQTVCVNEISLDGLQKLVDVGWPLKHLRIRSFDSSERPTWGVFVHFISPFSEFLVELDILDSISHKFSEKRSKTDLPEFKKLSFVCTKIEYLYSGEFQNFLSRCTSLYELKVEQPEFTNEINCNTDVEKAKELLSRFKQLWEVVLFHYIENSRNSIYLVNRTLH
ncbi:unnamed protein product [Orchesella dallaii]|uniref:F-box domain-containing protein n=1 Tax=Orchesella dallaii TaxID=48710 RepID=A0ABP1RKQ5_9HEXA